MDNWGEVRTAFQVALHGTVSGAAEALGVHHATVIRRIDALEAQLGTRLFQRHPRGYALTEPGQALLQVARSLTGRGLVSMLEGGYDLQALANSTEAHIQSLLED